jgi:uncharacterized protein YkwD
MLHRFSFLSAVAVLAAALVAVPSATAVSACASARATPANADQRTTVRATLCTLNAQRHSYGLRPLKLNERLSWAARLHARDMVRRDYFGHDSLDGGTFVDRIRRSGYLRGAGGWTVGENLAWGTRQFSTPGAVTEMWMNSAGHRANILNAAFREVGIGVAIGAPGAGGRGATYATEFGAKG